MEKEELRNLLKNEDISVKKSLGQNFLINEALNARIVDFAQIKPGERILEIGPGLGFLTDFLLQAKAKVTACEVSPTLSAYLRKKYSGQPNFRLIEDDILKVEINKVWPDLPLNPIENDEGRFLGEYRVVANLPFYLSGRIIPFFLESKVKPREINLLLQKEVAFKLAADNGKESLLSLANKFFAEVSLGFEVGRENFYPEPEVDTHLVRIKTNAQVPKVSSQKLYFQVLKVAFSGKRKQLHNSLSAGFHLTKEEAKNWIRRAGIDPAIRPEQLKAEDFVRIANEAKN